MAYSFNFPGEPETLDVTKIHQSASARARQAYLDAYGIDYHDDPQWKIGGERHRLWLDAFDDRQVSLIVNPNQE